MPEYVTPPKVFINGRELPGVSNVEISTVRVPDPPTFDEVSIMTRGWAELSGPSFHLETHIHVEAERPRSGLSMWGIRAVVDEVLDWDEQMWLQARAADMIQEARRRLDVATDTHPFEQHPEEEAKLCYQCGMWPEHHAHRRFGSGRCVCPDCMPEAEDLPDPSDWTSGDDWIVPEEDME